MAERLLPSLSEKQTAQGLRTIIRQSESFRREFAQSRLHGGSLPPSPIEPAFLLVRAARTGNDPLYIMDDLSEYNRQDPSRALSEKEFEAAVVVSGALYDLGKIMSGFTSDGAPVYHEGYRLDGTEAVSKEIARELLERSMPGSDRHKYQRFIEHFIDQTIYRTPTEKDPRARREPWQEFIRVVDQVGSGYFGGEISDEIPLSSEAIFPGARFEQLVPDRDSRLHIQAIWGVSYAVKELQRRKETREKLIGRERSLEHARAISEGQLRAGSSRRELFQEHIEPDARRRKMFSFVRGLPPGMKQARFERMERIPDNYWALGEAFVTK